MKENYADNDINDKAFRETIQKELAKKSITVDRMKIPQNFAHIGKSIKEIDFRSRTGISVVSIIRGEEVINIPDGNTRIFPFDEYVVVGSEEQIQVFMNLLATKNDDLKTNINPFDF